MFKIFKTAAEKAAVAEAKKRKNETEFTSFRIDNVSSMAGEIMLLSKLRGDLIAQNEHRGSESESAKKVIEQIDSKLADAVFDLGKKEYTNLPSKYHRSFLEKALKKTLAKKYAVE